MEKASNSSVETPSMYRALKPRVAELIFWKDPKKSGAAFGAGLVLLFSLACCSIISVVAYLSLAVLTGTLSFRVYKNVLQAVQKTNEGHPFKEYLELEVTPPNERVHQVVDVVLSHVNSVAVKLRSVFLVEDIVDSLKYVVLFWCMTYIGSWFNGMTLVILAYLGLFSLPKVYEMNKTQVDQYLHLACTQVQDVVTKAKDKMPFLARKEKDQ